LAKLEENLKKSNHEKDNEIKELQNQLRDVMFYLDAQSKMSQSKDVSNEEIQNSQLIIQQEEASSTSTQSKSAKMANSRKRNK
jgi:BRCA1-associated protein